MKRFLFLTIVLLLCSSCEKEQKTSIEQPTHSVLILKNFNPTNRVYFGKSYVVIPYSPISIINPYSLNSQDITDFNNQSDTIRIEHSSDFMLAGVNYSPLISNTYYFRAGDTLVVDFSDLNNIKEYYLNKNVFFGDVPPIFKKDTLAYKSEFFDYDKESIKKRKEEDSLKQEISVRNLESLHKTKQIYEPFYKIRKQRFEYSRKANNFNANDITYLKKDTLIGLIEYQYFLREFIEKKQRIISYFIIYVKCYKIFLTTILWNVFISLNNQQKTHL